MKKKAKQQIEYTVGSGNVYTDLGYTDPHRSYVKAELAILIAETIKEKKITQKRAAELMGLDQPKVSAIICGKISKFSIDRLFHCLLALGIDIMIQTTPHVSNTPAYIQVFPRIKHSGFSITA